jgi:hypothetical protein
MKKMIAGVATLAFCALSPTFALATTPTGQIEDCESFANQVVQIVDASFREKGGMNGAEVNQLQKSYPGIPRNHLQFYMAPAGVLFATSGGNVNAVFASTMEKCNKFH